MDCGSLSDPANGFVTTLKGTTFESLATYTCNEGFVLSSTASGTCLSSGHWSFTAPTCQPDPECLPLGKLGNCTVIECLNIYLHTHVMGIIVSAPLIP